MGCDHDLRGSFVKSGVGWRDTLAGCWAMDDRYVCEGRDDGCCGS